MLSLLHISDLHFGPYYLPDVGEAATWVVDLERLRGTSTNLLGLLRHVGCPSMAPKRNRRRISPGGQPGLAGAGPTVALAEGARQAESGITRAPCFALSGRLFPSDYVPQGGAPSAEAADSTLPWAGMAS